MSEKMINCKVCETDVAKTAKMCPNCGAVIKKPIYKKWWFSLMAVLFLFVVAVNSDVETENENTVNTENSLSEEVTNEVSDDSKDVSNEKTMSKISEDYLYISENANDKFNIQEKAIKFIDEHAEYFPGNDSNKGAISDYVDAEITYGHLSKNISKYGDKLIEISGNVIDIDESEDGSVTYVHVNDYDGKNYILYYLGTLDDIFEETYVFAYALPLDIITFENMENTYTEAIVCAACYVSEYEY